jgi:20S proteasome alpha/beta subunit
VLLGSDKYIGMGDMNFSLTTFNKTGKLMQIEYALARVQQGKMALGIKGRKLS